MAGLGIDIGIRGDASGVLASLGKLQGQVGGLEKNVGSLSSAWGGMKGQILAWKDTIALAVAIAKKSFDVLIGSAFDSADRIGTLSKQTGIAAESLQRLGHAAALSDSSFDSMSSALKILSKNVGNAVGGSKEAADAFAQIGLSAEELADMKTEDIFLQIAHAIHTGGIPESERMAVAMKLLGRGAAEMMPMLLAGADSIEAMGAKAQVMSDETIAAVKDADDAWKQIKETFSGLSKQVLAGLAPALKVVSEWMADTLPAAVEIGKSVIEAYFATWQKIIDVTIATGEVFGEILQPAIDAAAEALSSLGSGALRIAVDAFESLFGPVDGFALSLKDVAIAVLDFEVSLGTAMRTAAEHVNYWARSAGAIVGVFISQFGELIPRIGRILGELGGAFTDFGGSLGAILYESGKAAGQALWNGITGKGFQIDYSGVETQLEVLRQKINARINSIAGEAGKIGDAFEDALESEKRAHEERLAQIGDEDEATRAQTREMISEIEKKIAARRKERDAAKATAEEERKAAAATRDLADAMDESSKSAEANARALGKVGKEASNLVAVSERTKNKVRGETVAMGAPEAPQGPKADFLKAMDPKYAAKVVLGGPLGQADAGVNFIGRREFGSKEARDAYIQHANEIAALDQKIADGYRRMKSREDREAVEALERERAAVLKKVRDESAAKQKAAKEEADAQKKREEAAKKADEAAKKAAEETKKGMEQAKEATEDAAGAASGGGGGGGGKGDGAGSPPPLDQALENAEKAKEGFVEDVVEEMPKAKEKIKETGEAAGELAESLGKAGKATSGGGGGGQISIPHAGGVSMGDGGTVQTPGGGGGRATRSSGGGGGSSGPGFVLPATPTAVLIETGKVTTQAPRLEIVAPRVTLKSDRFEIPGLARENISGLITMGAASDTSTPQRAVRTRARTTPAAPVQQVNNININQTNTVERQADVNELARTLGRRLTTELRKAGPIVA